MRGSLIPTALTLGLCMLSTVASASVESRGELALESRLFLDDDNPMTIDRALGMMGRVQIDHKSKPFRERLRLYGRLDREDPERTLLVIEEAWMEWRIKPFKLRVGIDMLNWTATEAFHPADILNSRNLDSDLRNYEKVGEPMVALSLRTGSGTLTLYHMPTFIEPILPSSGSRLSLSGGQEVELGRLDTSGSLTNTWFVPQFALRLTHVFDNIDLSIHAIHHQDRSQPAIALSQNQPTAVFQMVTQVGGTYQQVIDALLFKLEFGWRMFHSPADDTELIFFDGNPGQADHGRVALGLEYGFNHSSGAESTLLLEAQVVIGPERKLAATLDIFQADVLVGYRLAFNNVSSTVLTASLIGDVEYLGECIGVVGLETRLSDTWSLRGSARLVIAEQADLPVGARPLQQLRDSDYLSMNLIRHF